MSSAPSPFSDYRIPSPPVSRRRRFSPWTFSRVSTRDRRKARASISLCSQNGSREVGVTHAGDLNECSSDSNDRENGKQTASFFSSKELMQRLKRYGVAGVLAYGLLNTVYYLITFLLVWFYFAPAPGRMGYAAAVQRFLKVMAMVWAGSQVTKIVRAGGALALAPFVDKGLSWITIKLKFKSRGKAFAAIVGVCVGVALLLFFGLTLLWA